MIKQINHETKKRTDNAIVNIRLIASRVKRANIEDAAQRREIVVALLNEFRQYIAINAGDTYVVQQFGTFKHDRETFERVKLAIYQADAIWHQLTRVNQKRYDTEHTQVWRLLEDVQAYLLDFVKGSNSHA